MIEQVLKSNTKRTNMEDIQVVYRVLFKNALYSMECYVEGNTDKNNYCYIENITEDEGEAETFLKLISNEKVLPVHVKDIAEDFLGK